MAFRQEICSGLAIYPASRPTSVLADEQRGIAERPRKGLGSFLGATDACRSSTRDSTVTKTTEMSQGLVTVVSMSARTHTQLFHHLRCAWLSLWRITEFACVAREKPHSTPPACRCVNSHSSRSEALGAVAERLFVLAPYQRKCGELPTFTLCIRRSVATAPTRGRTP